MSVPHFAFRRVARRITGRRTRIIIRFLSVSALLALSFQSLMRADPPGLSVLMHWELSNGTSSEIFFSDLSGNLGSSGTAEVFRSCQDKIESLIQGRSITRGSYCYVVHHG